MTLTKRVMKGTNGQKRMVLVLVSARLADRGGKGTKSPPVHVCGKQVEIRGVIDIHARVVFVEGCARSGNTFVAERGGRSRGVGDRAVDGA